MAGEYTAPPAHGPMMALICGMTPLANVFAQKNLGIPGKRHDPS